MPIFIKKTSFNGAVVLSKVGNLLELFVIEIIIGNILMHDFLCLLIYLFAP